MTRRWSAPEVIQTSSMDCGPACLASVLRGFGIAVSYERVRQQCHTDVDGTSIDVLEELANELGLVAEQIVLPEDHLLVPSAETTPSILVVQQAGGPTHFVVVWRVVGPWVQIMDPGGGRRWTTRTALRRLAHRLTHQVDAADWRHWAGSPQAQATYHTRLARHVSSAEATALLDAAGEDPSPRSLAALDAATRLTTLLVESGALRGRSTIEKFVRRAYERAREEGPGEAFPPPLWNVMPSGPDEQGNPTLAFRGVVLVRFLGRVERPADAPTAATEPSRPQAASTNQRWAALARLVALARDSAAMGRLLALAGLVFATAGTRTLVALLLSLLLDFEAYFAAPIEKALGLGLLLVPLFAQLALETSIVGGTLAVGRRLELELRRRVAARLARVSHDYVATRPRSDLAERLHSMHVLRSYAGIVRVAIESGATLLAVVVALAVLDRSLGWVALLAAVLTATTPVLFFSFIGERDMRLRALRGSLTIFDLDVMMGASAIRAHRAEKVLLDAQEERLTEWVRAGRGLVRAQTVLALVVGAVGVAASVALVWTAASSALGPAGLVLVVYWGLLIPAQGIQLGESLLAHSAILNVLLRVADLAEHPPATEPASNPEPSDRPEAAAEVELCECTIVRGGHPVLHDLSLRIEPGQHVAVIGRSGAGKSTLALALMGMAHAQSGRATVDGRPAAELFASGPRRDVVWLDPSVQLWNRSLLDNLRYGHGGSVDAAALGRALDGAQLDEMLERLPGGLATPLGESGRCVSGGEGQRVRIGRALVRSPTPRLVLLDEAMRGLPGPQRRTVLSTLRERWRDATMVCVTHDIQAATTFDRVLVLDRGRLVEDGDPNDLAARDGSYLRRLLDRQQLVHEQVWGHDQWRRLRLQRGQLVEDRP